MNSKSYHYTKVLIVDDNATNILLLESMLKDDGYLYVSSCESAESAYAFLDKEAIDLILLDVMMPDIDGISACTYIKSLPQFHNISIIMVTADYSDETLTKSFEAGADDFTTKPINFINLNSRIKSVLSHKDKDSMLLDQTRATAMTEIMETISQQWGQPLLRIDALAKDLETSSKHKTINKTSLQESLKEIRAYALDLSKTIETFRDISKVEQKQASTDINKLLIYTLKIIQSSYKANNINIQFKEASPIKKVMVYPNELVRVLLNIFINSQEAFSSQEKNSKKVVQVLISQTDNHTSISIKDNAGGIKEELVETLFDPFVSTKKSSQGTGLGLYSCKQVIEKHLKGSITLVSKNSTCELLITLPSNFESA